MSIADEQQLFDACLEAPTLSERERLLEAHADSGIVSRVRRLLALHDEDSLAAGDLSPPEFPTLAAPHRVGPYRVLKPLGEGAMGDVYLAEQQAPVRRLVALKILKFGLATREVLARFELERQTLALLTHPNVARIFDAGTTEDGRPWFALEYVDGISLTRYCDDNRLDVAARLALFAQVCAGVQHAHLRGVIHRDLKPSNILVATIDGVALPKIIDFGIAKATGPAGDASDAYTRIGHLLGTPEYMSPEQVQLAPLDIDARTDVYSLGVVLYELLTGTRPYAVSRDSLDPGSLAREIIEADPERPSTRVLRPLDDVDTRAERRRRTPRSLSAELRGEFDWIVLKALEKDRQRRYLSAAELASDLERARLHEPVLAGPPTAAYRVGKFVRRHRLGVAMVGSLFVATLVFGTGMAVLALQAARDRDRASSEAEVARRVTAFTAGLFEMASPSESGSSEVTARQLLDAGMRRLERELGKENPATRAALLEAAGNAYRGLGEYATAAPLLSQAISLRREGDPAAFAQVLYSDAELARLQGDLPRAEQRAREALAVATPLPESSGAQQLRIRLALANILRGESRLEEALALVQQARSAYATLQPPDAAGAADASLLLGRIYAAQGRLQEAERELSQALVLQQRLHGDVSEAALEAKTSLADVLVTEDESRRAEPLLREIVTDARHVFGPEHINTGVALSNLGNALSDIPEKFPEAEQVYLQAIALLRNSAGPRHPQLATALNNLGSLYTKTQRWQEARVAYEESASIRTVVFGARHPDTAAAELGEALALNKLNQFARAEQLLRSAVATFTLNLGADHWRTANAERYLGTVLTNLGRYNDAEAYLVAAEHKLTVALGPDHARTQSARHALEELATDRAAARVTARAPTP